MYWNMVHLMGCLRKDVERRKRSSEVRVGHLLFQSPVGRFSRREIGVLLE